MKNIWYRDAHLSYPNFSEELIINTDASKTQLGEVIRQNGKPTDFYPCKLTPAQINSITPQIELLSIVETLKVFHTNLLG